MCAVLVHLAGVRDVAAGGAWLQRADPAHLPSVQE